MTRITRAPDRSLPARRYVLLSQFIDVARQSSHYSKATLELGGCQRHFSAHLPFAFSPVAKGACFLGLGFRVARKLGDPYQ